MDSLDERHIIAGKPLPYRSKSEDIVLGEIGITEAGLEVVLLGSPFGPLKCGCEIWEHTIYEMETLSSALHCAAADTFPPDLEVPRPEGRIGTRKSLPLAVSIEVGYSLGTPGASRATFFCSSRTWGKLVRDRELGVLIGLAVSGGYREVVVEPARAIALADWLDQWVAQMWD